MQSSSYNSYSQHGEDLFLLNLFQLLEIDHPSYLDLGAHHPLVISNTALFYERGSRGVNVEANPILFKEFEVGRPHDLNVNKAVALSFGKFPFYRVEPLSGLNTLVYEELNRVGLTYTDIVEVEAIPIEEVLKTYCKDIWPDFLNTDIEGLDYKILEAAHFEGYGPKIICSEIRQEEHDRTRQLMARKGYHCLCRFSANLIFVRYGYLDKLR